MEKGISMTNSDPLDDLFAEASARPMAASSEFLARVHADAIAHQPQPRTVAAPSARPGMGFLARMIAAVGGAGALAGISSAAMAGLVVGYVQPSGLVSLAGDYGIVSSGDVVDLLPGYDALIAEE